ncbi:hypothetical protein D3C73_1355760 [compost metagenome]
MQRLGAQVLAIGVIQVAQQHVLAVGRQVQGHASVLVLRCIAAQTIGCIEAANDLRAFFFDLADCRRQFFGVEQGALQQGCAQGHRQQMAEAGHGSFLGGVA